MSNAARKARKKAGIQFSKPAKVGTPPQLRALPTVTKFDPFFGFGTWPSNRAKARIARLYGAPKARPSKWGHSTAKTVIDEIKKLTHPKSAA